MSQPKTARASGSAWPKAPWSLPVAESYVLLNGAGSDGAVFYLVLLEAISGGAFKLVATVVGAEPEADGPFLVAASTDTIPGASQTIFGLFERHARRLPDGSMHASLYDVAGAIARQYPSGKQFAAHVVAPSLVEYGLYERGEHTVLKVFHEHDYAITAAGRATTDLLMQWLELARDYGKRWADLNPNLATEFQHRAGSALYFVEGGPRELEQTREHLEACLERHADPFGGLFALGMDPGAPQPYWETPRQWSALIHEDWLEARSGGPA